MPATRVPELRDDSGSQPYAEIARRLGAERCVVLDGGIATALPEWASRGGDDERLWGMRALVDAPASVLEVHRGYVEAGADVISTDTWGLPTALLEDGGQVLDGSPAMHWMDLARLAVRVARQAVSEADGAGVGAVAFSLNGDLDHPSGEETARLLARAFGDEPPDLILLETLSVVRPSLIGVVEQLVATGYPVWLSFRRCRDGLCGVHGEHWGGPEGDAFGRRVREFEELGVGAVLANCTPPDHVDGMVSYLRDFTDLPLGVYPNLGYYTTAGWQYEEDVDGPRYAEMARRWRAEGAQIVGGCCGVGPEHIAAARAALEDTKPGRERRPRPPAPAVSAEPWSDAYGRPVYPVPFPEIVVPDEALRTPESGYLAWKHLAEHRIGAHARCLDVGCGSGLLAIQLALNGAAHVHAIDVDERACAATMDNAFRNEVAGRLTVAAEDLYPWIPAERYDVVVACLPQTPTAPQLTSHRPVDFWGRGLVDQVIAKLPLALERDGTAYLVHESTLSRQRTVELLARHGLAATVAAWQPFDADAAFARNRDQIDQVERLSDAHHLDVGGVDVLVAYLLEIRHAA